MFHNVSQTRERKCITPLQELEAFIEDFNGRLDEDFSIDSIRIEFSKQHKKKKLDEVGKWDKIAKNSPLLPKLQKRLLDGEISTVWRLENYNIYYYNMRDKPKYRKATLVIFGLKQYHKEPPPKEITSKLLEIMKDVSNIDICIDLPYKPNLEALGRYFLITPYLHHGIVTDTHYINTPHILMMDKIVIYNKAFKNSLKGVLWRIEAKISIPNFQALALPLHEFKEIVDILRIPYDKTKESYSHE